MQLAVLNSECRNRLLALGLLNTYESLRKTMRVFPIEDKQQPALRDFADLSFEGLEGPSATIIAETNYPKRATLRIAEGGIVMP